MHISLKQQPALQAKKLFVNWFTYQENNLLDQILP